MMKEQYELPEHGWMEKSKLEIYSWFNEERIKIDSDRSMFVYVVVGVIATIQIVVIALFA